MIYHFKKKGEQLTKNIVYLADSCKMKISSKNTSSLSLKIRLSKCQTHHIQTVGHNFKKDNK